MPLFNSTKEYMGILVGVLEVDNFVNIPEKIHSCLEAKQ
jgi:hypothetical protein